MSVLGLGLLLQPLWGLLLLKLPVHRDLWLLLLLLTALLALGGAVVAGVRLHNQLLRPLVRLEQSALAVRHGEPGFVPPPGGRGVLGSVIEAIDSLGRELDEVYEDRDDRVWGQTRRLAQQATFLKILYDMAAAINRADSLDGLLLSFLPVLRRMLEGRSAIVLLVEPDGRERVVGGIDPQNRVMSGAEQEPERRCDCGKRLLHGDLLCGGSGPTCLADVASPLYSPERMQVVEVPLDYQGERFGRYRLFVDRTDTPPAAELLDLLSTVGSHLGVAVAKFRSDQEARRLSIVEERTRMAHELHDSLAQTLAGLRLQMHVVEESLVHESVSSEVQGDLARIRNGLDEAHTELRELLNNFLDPQGPVGLIAALGKVARRFRQESGVALFLQHNCSDEGLSPADTLQVLRIVQESLANVRKHAEAQNVRVLLSRVGATGFRLLVEDDGVGFDARLPGGRPGEHIGLSILEERARRVGGQLRIESEVGEGTRVELTLDPEARRQQRQREASERGGVNAE